MSAFTIHHGDCLDVLRGVESASVDSIVTDPPYGLSFMGKRWDYDVPSVEIWAECLRVLKPGGHLLAFAGTRTQHRMAVRIEDAGFEIRDLIAWVYSTGFPKSMNLDRLRGDAICGCDGSALPYTHERAEQTTEHQLQPVRGCDVSTAQLAGKECGEVLQQGVQEQGAPIEGRAQLSAAEVRAGESGVERRRDAPEAQGELCAGAVQASAGMGLADGEGRRVRDGAPACDGGMVRLLADEDGSSTSRGSRPTQQFAPELGAVAGQSQSQAVGAWPTCRGCSLPRIPRGLGTALKPALEPITVARKPLAGTVAENVLAHGTGALNIDGCRVEAADGDEVVTFDRHAGDRDRDQYRTGTVGNARPSDAGRWPANLIHDGSEEPAALLGDAARFFYCAKASKRDRDEGLDGFEAKPAASAYGDGMNTATKIRTADQADSGVSRDLRRNHHPTVKPTDLMRYLCRLVTPPGGVVLDPFTGSGSTGKAALLEGFRFIGIEREAEYVEIARARIQAAILPLMAA
jgi:DNA modification methylase